MSWLPFVLGYALVVSIIGIILHKKRILRLDSLALIRSLAVASALLLLGELIAEERGLWTIPAHSGILFFQTPIESFLLILTTTMNGLQTYVLVDHFTRRKAPSEG